MVPGAASPAPGNPGRLPGLAPRSRGADRQRRGGATRSQRCPLSCGGVNPAPEGVARGGRVDIGGRVGPLRHRPAGTVAPGKRSHPESDTGYALALRRSGRQATGAVRRSHPGYAARAVKPSAPWTAENRCEEDEDGVSQLTDPKKLPRPVVGLTVPITCVRPTCCCKSSSRRQGHRDEGVGSKG